MPRILVLCLLVTTGCAHLTRADDGAVNIFDNAQFARAGDNAAPAGWMWKGRQGTVELRREGEVEFVSIAVSGDSADNFIEQIARIPAEAVKLKLEARYRWTDIVGGDRGYQKGKVHGRFRKGGANAGGWIDLGNVTGSSDGWVVKRRTIDVPKEADGLLFRLGFYGSKAGRLDVDYFKAQVVTEADVAAERAQYRPAEAYGPAVSAARYGRLQQGVNINNWFCQPWNVKAHGKKGGFNAEFFRAYITNHDLKRIADAGFDHIRMATDPTFLMDKSTGDLDRELLGEYDRAIRMIREHGLAVIVDVHPKSNSYKKMRGKPMAAKFIKWWGQFAAHLATTTDPEWVFLELLNEPGGQGFWTQSWQAYQDKLLTLVRAEAPDHTLIANGGAYMLAWELPKIEPHPDRNVIWAFHYYEPSPFTHQGAVWMKDWYRPLRDVPWPLTAENLAEAQAAVVEGDKASDKAKQVLSDQLKSGWGTKANTAKRFEPIAEWAQKHDRRVVVGEFGVYAKYAPRDARLRYLEHIVDEMERHGFGWSIWDYCGGGFQIVSNPDAPSEKRELDKPVIQALGLNPS